MTQSSGELGGCARASQNRWSNNQGADDAKQPQEGEGEGEGEGVGAEDPGAEDSKLQSVNQRRQLRHVLP